MRSWHLERVAVAAGLATLLIVAMGALAAGSAAAESGWALKGTWSDTCSCEVACPCFFGSGATEGHCEGTSLLEIEEGH